MPDNNPYYGLRSESTPGTTPGNLPISRLPYDPALIDDGNPRKPRRSLLSRLFHRKAKKPVVVRESRQLGKFVEAELQHEGVLYRGLLHAVEEEEQE